jgi:tripeptide aminopeptidase
LEYENFNAASAKITVEGRSVHPGEAKNKMINASLVAHKIVAMLPAEQRPEYTELREGFFHLLSFNGNVEHAELEFIIRDHSREKFLRKKELFQKIIAVINAEFRKEIARLEMNDQYYNMLEKIEPVMWVADIAREAILKAGVQPKFSAIRGGTDGARLSFAGLPCPNIFAGGHNFHGPFEFIPIPSMQKAVEVILNICALVPSMAKK